MMKSLIFIWVICVIIVLACLISANNDTSVRGKAHGRTSAARRTPRSDRGYCRKRPPERPATAIDEARRYME